MVYELFFQTIFFIYLLSDNSYLNIHASYIWQVTSLLTYHLYIPYLLFHKKRRKKKEEKKKKKKKEKLNVNKQL